MHHAQTTTATTTTTAMTTDDDGLPTAPSAAALGRQCVDMSTALAMKAAAQEKELTAITGALRHERRERVAVTRRLLLAESRLDNAERRIVQFGRREHKCLAEIAILRLRLRHANSALHAARRLPPVSFPETTDLHSSELDVLVGGLQPPSSGGATSPERVWLSCALCSRGCLPLMRVYF